MSSYDEIIIIKSELARIANKRLFEILLTVRY
jgi:hypothetical protein